MKNKNKWFFKGFLLAVFLIGAGLHCYGAVDRQQEMRQKEEQEELEAARDEIREIYTLEYQQQVQESLEEKKKEGHYGVEDMLLVENPYGTDTLSLYVYFETEEPVSVSYTVSVEDESIPDFSGVPAGEEEPGTVHEFQMIGLVPDKVNKLQFTLTPEEGEASIWETSYEMGSLQGEEEIRLTSEITQEAEKLSQGLYVILGNDSDGLDFMYYYDNNGILRGEIPLIGYRSHRLVFEDGLMYYSISQTKLAAVNSLGQVKQVYDTGDYSLHHDYVLDDGGNLLVLATDTGSGTVEDQVIRIDTDTGQVDRVLDLGDLLGSYKESCLESSQEELDWMHINTIQWLGDETVLLSSRETSTILKISGLYSDPKVDHMIGEASFWEGTGYEDLLLAKDESNGSFSNTGGQHSITYVTEEDCQPGEYHLYMFNNNVGISQTREDYDWSQIEGIETSLEDGEDSYFYKYKVDEDTGTYTLVQSFPVPFSAYVSSAQEWGENIVIDSGMQGIFGEYDQEGNLLCQYRMELAKNYIYRVYKYDFTGFYFSRQ